MSKSFEQYARETCERMVSREEVRIASMLGHDINSIRGIAKGACTTDITMESVMQDFRLHYLQRSVKPIYLPRCACGKMLVPPPGITAMVCGLCDRCNGYGMRPVSVMPVRDEFIIPAIMAAVTILIVVATLVF